MFSLDEKSAEQFVKKNGNSIIRYPGSRTSNAESLVRKPKIYVYNFEDFVELWEEKILADKNLVENTCQKLFLMLTNIIYSSRI